jgi:hypothetical protein
LYATTGNSSLTILKELSPTISSPTTLNSLSHELKRTIKKRKGIVLKKEFLSIFIRKRLIYNNIF